MRYAATLSLLILACALPLASVEWVFSSPSDLNSDIAIISGNPVFASKDGVVYSASASDGSLLWSYDAGEPIDASPCAINASTLAVATRGGKVLFISTRGKETSRYQVGASPMWLACSTNRFFVATSDRVSSWSVQGKQIWNFSLSSPPGPLSLAGKSLYFTSGGKLYSLVSLTGVQNWASEAENSYLSRPQEFGDGVFFGATDGKLYSFSKVTGKRRFAYQTGGWVIGTPLFTDDSVLFGSADGSFYSLTENGNLQFKFKAGEGIWASPMAHAGAGGNVAVFGTTDGKLFGIDSSTGSEIWSFSTTGRVNSPQEASGLIFFTTNKAKLYAVSPSPMCSITSPPEGEVIGGWPLLVRGKAHSDSALLGVEVRANGGNWAIASGTDSWKATIDVSSLPDGQVLLECRSRDSSGKTESGTYSMLSVIKMQNAPLAKMAVSSPARVDRNETFAISVKDKDGNHLEGLSIAINGEKISESSPFSVLLGRSGPVDISIEKPGFEKVSFTVTGTGDELPLPLIFGLVLLLVLAFVAYTRFFGKKKE